MPGSARENRAVGWVHLELNLTALVAAAVEQHHAATGIVWTRALAPAAVHLVALNLEDAEVSQGAAELYAALRGGRDRCAVRRPRRPRRRQFAGADLLGLPVVLTLSRRTHPQAGELELQFRGEAPDIPRRRR